ncbi:alpha-D-ribose 1-methylphosphonate 5-triphosphate diphosphatase [Methylobacterium oryzihabitans]|uniref:Alpha-D-ribose 1-methylphosphonate 5-triphosphate diphosphatase n=1 Tax=Methylobacterium oryzihabitans TaxID=2499852 RepID=A0A3S2YRM5_9HYPH|nr:alpha-D-ribose 1-methylphosphonate 5-triphosphate diphosphatase [Methylobacterium oryzihabitans]RVU17457.1 alpha-D-ribose 1-methylphosphonate 5-triphosphate diphosphatase [Methylobacterium oryzihabitans]
MTDMLIENATLVLPDRVQHGWIAVTDGRIAEIGEGRAPERGLDLAGDTLIPGLVELHTDHLESHYVPRPKVRWHPLAAVIAYDAQIAASGITTVFDSLRAGSEPDESGLGRDLMRLAEAIEEGREAGLLRVDHRAHLRCELPCPDVVESVTAFAARLPVGLISLMDHTPGQRQFRDIEKYYIYARRSGRTLEEIQAATAAKIRDGHARNAANRPAIVAMARAAGIALASHDDTTLDDVAQSRDEGVAVAEFPTTIEAAQACHAAGITVMMGAPNLIRGGSHSGNVAAATLAKAGLLDILSSDYVPASLLMAAFALPEQAGIPLPQAIATVTANPARATGLDDRGALAPGLRADLVRVQVAAGIPVVRRVWRGGAQVA